ncbi:SigE family RNA polymerase sigma factor [Tessaracoccus sp. OS52]|uniref:SigE family RNA polymerase sigma factor n=1 Tax=Tessaracoccus sp. OS52 TaxID=2886691 RepID=UPI001D11EBA2|nr:SigE family RNA polymerase sigma factor [Tessaracoccus sp. OS52]
MTSPGFEAFVERRGKALWRAAWLLTGDAQKAEDLVQTALTRTYTRYADDDATFEAYVRTTIYRTFVSSWRRRWNGEVPTETLPERNAPDDNSALRVDVLRALGGLPKAQRAVLVLRYFEDKSIPEVAELLGLAPGTVKAYSHHALAALRGSIHLVEGRQ